MWIFAYFAKKGGIFYVTQALVRYRPSPTAICRNHHPADRYNSVRRSTVDRNTERNLIGVLLAAASAAIAALIDEFMNHQEEN